VASGFRETAGTYLGGNGCPGGLSLTAEVRPGGVGDIIFIGVQSDAILRVHTLSGGSHAVVVRQGSKTLDCIRPLAEADLPALLHLERAVWERREVESIDEATGRRWIKEGLSLGCFKGACLRNGKHLFPWALPIDFAGR
jgi:hypothetical protein